ncbi:unnamed protein product, partial [marine sediment metagenome]
MNRLEHRFDKDLRKYGSTQILGECGGPGGTMHA